MPTRSRNETTQLREFGTLPSVANRRRISYTGGYLQRTLFWRCSHTVMRARPLYRKRRGECVYCGAVGTLTDDHVPPRNLFPRDPPKNLVKVPCCYACNQAASKDDEYFRLVVAARDDLREHSVVREILPKAIRSLANPAKRGFSAAFLKTLRKVPAYTASGLYAGYRGAYDVNLRRLDAVVARIVKGLFYKQSGRRLPDNYEVTVLSEDGLKGAGPTELAELSRMLAAIFSAGARTGFRTSVFGYVSTVDSADPNTSAWLLTFYERVAFAALTTRFALSCDGETEHATTTSAARSHATA